MTGGSFWQSPGTASGGGGGSSLIGYGQYLPASDTVLSRSSSVFADVDVSAQATFTVPDSGVVVVVLQGMSNNTSNHQFWNVRDGSGDIAGTHRWVSWSSNHGGRHAARMRITGLTAGASKTLKWGWASSGTAHILAGPTNGPATMEVWSA